jgi:hypothetical protein
MKICIACHAPCDSEEFDRGANWTRFYCKTYGTYEISRRACTIANDYDTEKRKFFAELIKARATATVLRVSFKRSKHVGTYPRLAFSDGKAK